MKKLLIILLTPLLLQAQSLEKDLAKVYTNFVNAQHISYSIQYSLRAGHNEGSRHIMTSYGHFSRNNQSYLCAYDNIATLVTPKETVLIDNERKIIQVKRSKEKPVEEFDYKSILQVSAPNIEKASQLKTNKNSIIYDVVMKTNPYRPVDHYQISIDPKTHYLQKITLFYKKPMQANADYGVTGKEIPRLDITFSGFSTNGIDQETEAGYYYKLYNSKPSPTLNFKGYAIKEVF